MSGHADTIFGAEKVMRRLEYMSGSIANDIMVGLCEETLAALDALLAENQRLHRERDNWHASNYAERQARLKAEAEVVLLRNLYDELFDQCALIRAERDALAGGTGPMNVDAEGRVFDVQPPLAGGADG